MQKGAIENRETFLDNVASQLGRNRRKDNVTRPKWKHQAQWKVLADLTEDELVDVLEKQCQVIHTDFVRTTEEELGAKVLQVLQAYGVKTALTWDDPRFSSFGLTNKYVDWKSSSDIDVFKWDIENPVQSRHLAEQADVGITFSDITLAESGTVVLFSSDGKGRSVSLLPSTYIAIIPKSSLVPRMSQATREIHQRIESGEHIPSCINFITGPSNSADIEMNLVVGVHGPIKAAYIVVEDR
ncbi:lactate utilization protein C [Sediminibacillus dalangtanensis]|uniref:Lactate utilization protein C n=1 Tax=Sediminibacillus dalangtanensis TaxID=2729421 RepID=A0ABX7VUF1_9BACI|nr:lactate utilization protein C [Sediminibacillus dalangtanensis]QTN00515.1 lactate utilization protein C [Sediminibacillus dalangtanensis]